MEKLSLIDNKLDYRVFDSSLEEFKKALLHLGERTSFITMPASSLGFLFYHKEDPDYYYVDHVVFDLKRGLKIQRNRLAKELVKLTKQEETTFRNLGMIGLIGKEFVFFWDRIMPDIRTRISASGPALNDVDYARNIFLASKFYQKNENISLVIRTCDRLEARKIFAVLSDGYDFDSYENLLYIKEWLDERMGERSRVGHYRIEQSKLSVFFEYPQLSRDMRSRQGLAGDWLAGFFITNSDTGKSSLIIDKKVRWEKKETFIQVDRSGMYSHRYGVPYDEIKEEILNNYTFVNLAKVKDWVGSPSYQKAMKAAYTPTELKKASGELKDLYFRRNRRNRQVLEPVDLMVNN